MMLASFEQVFRLQQRDANTKESKDTVLESDDFPLRRSPLQGRRALIGLEKDFSFSLTLQNTVCCFLVSADCIFRVYANEMHQF